MLSASSRPHRRRSPSDTYALGGIQQARAQDTPSGIAVVKYSSDMRAWSRRFDMLRFRRSALQRGMFPCSAQCSSISTAPCSTSTSTRSCASTSRRSDRSSPRYSGRTDPRDGLVGGHRRNRGHVAPPPGKDQPRGVQRTVPRDDPGRPGSRGVRAAVRAVLPRGLPRTAQGLRPDAGRPRGGRDAVSNWASGWRSRPTRSSRARRSTSACAGPDLGDVEVHVGHHVREHARHQAARRRTSPRPPRCSESPQRRA